MKNQPEPAAVGGTMEFTAVSYRDGADQEIINGFDEGTHAGIPNEGVTKPVRIYGTYEPVGPDKIWIIRIGIKGAEYGATLNGEGGWHVEIPPNTLDVNSTELISVPECVMNGRRAYHGTGGNLTIGQSEIAAAAATGKRS